MLRGRRRLFRLCQVAGHATRLFPHCQKKVLIAVLNLPNCQNFFLIVCF